MNRGKYIPTSRSGGYTIIEVLIFLAVSSFMLVLAIMYVGGQQNKAEFTTAVRDFETKLNDIANDVATGYYVKPVNFQCDNNSGRPVPSSSATDVQGQNDECIFAGTVLKFGENSNRELLAQFTMAGVRTNSGGDNVTTIEEANPFPVYNAGLQDAVVRSSLGYGVRVVCVAVGSSCTAGSNSPAAVGFFSTFSSASASGQGSGIQTDVVAYDTVNFTQDLTASANNLDGVTTSDLNPNGGVVICLQSGGTSQYALIRLGGDSGGLGITTEIKNFSGSNPSCD